MADTNRMPEGLPADSDAAPRRPRPPVSTVVVGLAAFAAAVLLRAPRLISAPRFSAEEGSVYFQSALEHGLLGTLFGPHMDYIVLYTNVAVVAAERLVPLAAAPLVTTIAALLLQLVAPALVLTSRAAVWRASWRRFAAVAALLLVQPSATVWLTTNAAAFHAAVIVFLLLVEPTDGVSRRRAVVQRALIAVCGLTGPVSSFLLPAFAHRAWQRRDRESTVQAVILGLGAVVQLGALIVSRSRPDGLHRSLVVDPGTTGFALLNRSIVQPVLGVGAASDLAVWIERMGEASYQAVGVAAGLAVVALLWRACGRETELRTHVVAMVCLVIPTLLFATGSNLLDTRRHLLHPLVHDRYVYAPAVLTVLFALRMTQASRRLPARVMAALAVAAALSIGAVTYRSSMRHHVHSGQPEWRAEVARVQRGDSAMARVWPATFVVRVPNPPTRPE